jgi:hypothetical protein
MLIMKGDSHLGLSAQAPVLLEASSIRTNSRASLTQVIH